MNKRIINEYVDELYEMYTKGIDSNIIETCKVLFIDYFGVSIAGSKQLKTILTPGYIKELGDVRTIGFSNKFNDLYAGLLLGMASHILELDDGNRFGMIHIASPVISTILVLSQKLNLSLSELYLATTVGYEASLRFSYAIQPGHKLKGFHATAICGAIGATIAGGLLLGFNKPLLINAISITAANVSGLIAVSRGSSDLKSVSSGKAALNAILSLNLTLMNIKGNTEIFYSDNGFFDIFSNGFDRLKLINKVNDELAINQSYFKIYSSCRHTHPSIDATKNIIDRYNIDINYIERIKVYTYDLAVNGHDHNVINSVIEAKMSIPYCVCAMVILGEVGLSSFSNRNIGLIKSSHILHLIDIISDETFSKTVPEKRPAKVEIQMKNGEKLFDYVEYCKGDPENPLSVFELEKKFYDMLEYSGIKFEKSKDILSLIKDSNIKVISLIDKINEAI